MSEGFVYVMSNPAMPGLVKVGMTERLPHVRAAEIGDHEGLPVPMVVEYYALVQGRAGEVERAVHKQLSAVRAGKEWFRCDAELAVAVVQQTAGPRKQYEKHVRADLSRTEVERRRLEEERQAVEKKKRVEAEQEERKLAHMRAVDDAYRKAKDEFLRLEPVARKTYERHDSIARAIVDEFTLRDLRQASKDERDRVPDGVRPLHQWPLADILLLASFNQLDFYLGKAGGRPKKHSSKVARELFGDYFWVPEFVIREFSRRRDEAYDKSPFRNCLYPEYAQFFK